MFKVRASALGNVMTRAKSINRDLLSDELKKVAGKKEKTKEEQEALEPYYWLTLSEGAATFVADKVQQEYYDFVPEFQNDQMQKGWDVEDKAIELYNTIDFTSYVKNTERLENEWLTGTCDIDTGHKIVDIKSAWSKKTMPIFAADLQVSLYEWQVRAYMMLWGREHAEVFWCLLDTPDYLIGYESEELHLVEDIDPVRRMRTVKYQRDPVKEQQIKWRVGACQHYYNQLWKELTA